MMRGRIYGAVTLDSLIISYPGLSRRRLNGLYDRHGVDGVVSFDKLRWADLSPQDRTDLITEQHEEDHFVILTSTPAGVLLWRLHQVISRDVMWIAHERDKHGTPLTLARLAQRKLPDVLAEDLMTMTDPPPLKWSALRYVLERMEKADGKEEVQAGGDCCEAPAG